MTLEDLKKLEREATAGDWEKRAWASIQNAEFVHVADCFQKPQDAKFIAASRNMLPKLIRVAQAVLSLKDAESRHPALGNASWAEIDWTTIVEIKEALTALEAEDGK